MIGAGWWPSMMIVRRPGFAKRLNGMAMMCSITAAWRLV